MYNKSTKIGVIGSGVVGQVLSNAFLTEGNPVMLGTRRKDKKEIMHWQEKNPSGKVGSFEETAAFGEILVLAVAGEVAEDAVRLSGFQNFEGKIVIDATNPLSKNLPPVNGVLQVFTKSNDSLMEHLQALVPPAFFVKAFNSVGNALMYKPGFKETPTMFICGNNADAKQGVTTILSNFGWEAADMGAAEAARAIEPLCVLWCIPGFLQNSWSHAFKLLR